jgi:predicted amidohydrolase
MTRKLNLAAAQLGPIARDEPRSHVVKRMIGLMHDAKHRGCELVVYPELALTTFFPRWFMTDQAEIDAFFETEMPSAEVQPLFDEAKKLGIGFHLGFAEKVEEDGKTRRFNTAILVDSSGQIFGKYRKIHLPGHADHEPWRPFQHLEKRYFEVGNLGFPVFDSAYGRLATLICNDRRWPEAWRSLGLQKAELVMVGYNTPRHYPNAPQQDHLNDFHNRLSLQAGAYQNGTWVVGTAKAGIEEDCELIGGSCIVAPTGEIVAQATTLDDELVSATADMSRCKEIQDNIFNFALHRQPWAYRRLVEAHEADA